MQKIIRVFICHWHGGYRNFLIRNIHNTTKFEQTIEVIGHCADHRDCLEWFESNDADFLLVDFAHSGGTKMDKLELVIQNIPQTKVVVLSVLESESMSEFYKKMGAFAHYNQDDNYHDKLLEIIAQ